MKNRFPFRMPNAVKITGRSSSITNSFVNGIIPCIKPTDEQIAAALTVLEMDPDNVACAYCGNAMTEWDHLNPLVMDKQATGFITEIQNLVPACGKCNQTNGNRTDYLFDPRKLEVGQSYPLEETSLSRRDR